VQISICRRKLHDQADRHSSAVSRILRGWMTTLPLVTRHRISMFRTRTSTAALPALRTDTANDAFRELNLGSSYATVQARVRTESYSSDAHCSPAL
jgi:hypothetical protein